MNQDPLIHIGYHKTGTTWLQQRVFTQKDWGFLQVNPRLIVDEAFIGVNPFVFDAAKARAMFDPLFEKSERLGLVPVISHEPLSGAPLINGIDAQPIADRLIETFSNARVLIVLREQKSWMASVYKQYILSFGTRSFRQLYKDPTLRERRGPGPGLAVFEYHYLVAYYHKLYGADRVLVLPYEQLARDPVTFTGQICKFVGLAAPTEVPSEREHVSVNAAATAVFRYANLLLRNTGFELVFAGPPGDRRIRQQRMQAMRKLGRLAPKSMAKRVERRWRRLASEAAGDRFAKSNRILSDMTGLDLAAYGWDMAPPEPGPAVATPEPTAAVTSPEPASPAVTSPGAAEPAQTEPVRSQALDHTPPR